MSHSRTVWSQLAEANNLPSGLNATLETLLEWPFSGSPSGWRLAKSHSRTVWSKLVEASSLPSGLNATLIQTKAEGPI